MSYTIDVTNAAARELRRLTPEVQLRLNAVLIALEDDPRPAGCRKLKGRTDEYRVRDGDYRIVYKIRDRQLLVVVIHVGNRRDVYR
jgi:mRNA interferase RelE/StbE